MGFLSKLFGNKDNSIQEFMDRKAMIIDVRTPAEYKTVSIPGSKNIPLQTVPTKLAKIKAQNKPVIVYCASGMRSASAAAAMKSAGIEVLNAGSINRMMKFF